MLLSSNLLFFLDDFVSVSLVPEILYFQQIYWQSRVPNLLSFTKVLSTISSNRSGTLIIKALYGSVLTKQCMLVWYYVLHCRARFKFYRETLKKNCFTQDSWVNEPLSPERIFVSSMSFCWNFYIIRLLYCKKFDCVQ